VLEKHAVGEDVAASDFLQKMEILCGVIEESDKVEWCMTVTITAKGQITIPLKLRQKFHLEVGDQLDFDESAPVLTARRVVNRDDWTCALRDWQETASKNLKDHPWGDQTAASIVDDLRGGPAEAVAEK
jgi:AbrB family looped-hinge helix DNA binding protein